MLALVTRPDKPRGRGRKVESSPLVDLARSRNVPVLQPPSARDAAFAAELDLPSWFGANLDALAECLGHLARTAEGEWELVVDGVAELGREDPRALAGLGGLLDDIARAHPRFHVTVIER